MGALTLYPMDDHDDRPGRKSETYPGVASVSGSVPYSAGLDPELDRQGSQY